MQDLINRAARKTPTWVFYLAAIALAVWTVYGAVQTPDPAKVLERDLGTRGLQILILTDLTKRPYIIIGFAAFVALIPLAFTSNLWSIKRMGAQRWKQLHWLVYPAVLAGAVHFILIGKVYTLESALYFAVAAGLLIARRLKSRKAVLQTA